MCILSGIKVLAKIVEMTPGGLRHFSAKLGLMHCPQPQELLDCYET